MKKFVNRVGSPLPALAKPTAWAFAILGWAIWWLVAFPILCLVAGVQASYEVYWSGE